MKPGKICSPFLIAGILLIVPACALRKGPPDPAKVQQEVDDARNEVHEQQVAIIPPFLYQLCDTNSCGWMSEKMRL